MSPDYPEATLEVSIDYCDPADPKQVDGALVMSGMQCEHPVATCFGVHWAGYEDREYWTPQATYHVSVERAKHDKTWKVATDLIPQVRFDALEAQCIKKTGKPCVVTLGEWKGPKLGVPFPQHVPKLSFEESQRRCRTPLSER